MQIQKIILLFGVFCEKHNKRNKVNWVLTILNEHSVCSIRYMIEVNLSSREIHLALVEYEQKFLVLKTEEHNQRE